MKKYITLILALAMLTACTAQPAQASETSSEAAVTTAAPAVTSAPTVATAAEQTSATETTEYAPDFELLPNMRLVKIDNNPKRYTYCQSLGDGRVFTLKYGSNGEKTNLVVYDTDTDTQITTPLPEGFTDFMNLRKGVGDNLYILTSERCEFGDEDENHIANRVAYTQDVIKIKTDYSIECIKNADITDAAFDMKGHTLGVWDSSIYDLGGEPKIIVEGKPWNHYYSKSMHYRVFDCAIDENRFVSSSHFYEGVGGFCIYDFKKGKVVFTYDSGTQVLGAHNNIIYFVLAEYGWDGDGKIYACNADTFETSVYMDLLSDEYMDYGYFSCISPDGKYMAFNGSRKNGCGMMVIETETKKIVAEYDIGTLSPAFFADNDTLVLPNQYNSFVVVDIEH